VLFFVPLIEVLL
jgi:hypothetical protein